MKRSLSDSSTICIKSAIAMYTNVTRGLVGALDLLTDGFPDLVTLDHLVKFIVLKVIKFVAEKPISLVSNPLYFLEM